MHLLKNRILRKIFRILFLIMVLYQYSMSQTIEEDFYKPVMNILADSVINGMKNLDEYLFVSGKYNLKDLNLTVTTFMPMTDVSSILWDSILVYEKCTRHFDSCFCGFDPEGLQKALLRGFHRYLNNRPFDIYQELEPLKQDCYKIREQWIERLSADTIDGKYIPKDIEDAIQQAMKIIPQKRLDGIKALREEDVIAEEHYNLGHFLRNYWELYGSRLSIYFNEKYGVYATDGMSGCLLLFLHRRLNNKDLEIEKTIMDEIESSKKYNEP